MDIKEMHRRATVLDRRSSNRGLPCLEEILTLADAEHQPDDWKQRFGKLLADREHIAADGIFYHDTREPFMAADLSPVTLLTTDLALYPVSNFPVLGGQYWTRPGKALRIRLFGKITTVLTPGNGTFDIYYGSGAAANGTILASSATFALTASQTNLSWELDIKIRCVTIGSAGTLYVTGHALFNNAVVATSIQPLMIPASAAAASAGVDLTAANIISCQFKRSGSTAETMTVQDMEVVSLN